ncbi:uncharacterized protein LOC132205244 [Neocloeon triangulifer]|uniref:uncharacterized protein LOC132205244 n=1 Tax=Neocloeon triangulifer TaxID=2078957 RepID=UPI00286FA156|nr:uncharacterized protein LOC132205244 [Neocloeon triangulifer]
MKSVVENAKHNDNIYYAYSGFAYLYAKIFVGCGKKFAYINFNPPTSQHNLPYEICCHFGMNLVTVESREKAECMASIGFYTGFNITYRIAGSRMGLTSGSPRWCLSNLKFNASMLPNNFATSDPKLHVLAITFSKASTLFDLGAKTTLIMACERDP